MTIVTPQVEHKNLYCRLAYWLNAHQGRLQGNDKLYYQFLDNNRVTHEQVLRAVKLCENLYDKSIANVMHRDARMERGSEGGVFYLLINYNKVDRLPADKLPPLFPEPEKIILSVKDLTEPKKDKEPQEQWTKSQVIDLLTNQAHIVGRMLGTGYDLLEPIHGEWIQQWLVNPQSFKIMIHQAHRDSYKTTCLRLFGAIFAILYPRKTAIIIRKSEDAVKELINGISKILDTPLFHTFVNILYPDIREKGGFKKVADTALSIDTNLNIGLSGEYQIRAVGLGSPLTGKHASLIITDDIVTRQDRESDAIRYETLSVYRELMNVLSDNKGFNDTYILNIGTPWHEEDAFALMKRGLKPITDEQEELEEISTSERTPEQNERIRQLNMVRGLFVYNCYQTGLMSEEAIEFKRQTLNDEPLFQANYLLTLVSDDEKPFNKIDNVGNYQKSFIQDAWEVFAHIDEKYRGIDTCALTIGAFNWDTYEAVLLGKIWKGVSLDQNYMEFAEIMFDCGVQVLFMETNTTKGLMGQKFEELGFIVIGYHEGQNKHSKIRGTIRPFWRIRTKENIHLPCVQFVEETDEAYLEQIWNYKKGVKTDDAPDSCASLLLRAKFGAVSIRVT